MLALIYSLQPKIISLTFKINIALLANTKYKLIITVPRHKDKIFCSQVYFKKF